MDRVWRRRLVLILEFEPSWFAEFMSAVGVIMWSSFAFLTDDFTVTGWAITMPAAGLVFGPMRIWLLLRLDPRPRVVGACLGFIWWAWLVTSLMEQLGVVPSQGAFSALALGDVLTVCKFSVSALRLRDQPRGA